MNDETEEIEDEDGPNYVWTDKMGTYVNIDRGYDGRNLSRREKRALKREKRCQALMQKDSTSV